VSYATDKGARPYQEDRLVVRIVKQDNELVKGILLGVADGHGGDQTSSYVSHQLSAGLFDVILANQNGSHNEAVLKTFEYLNDNTLELCDKHNLHYESGTTLSLVFIPASQEKAYVGIIGDSPVILANSDKSIHVSPEHNARTNEEERKEAVLRGGRYIDGYLMPPFGSYGLQMTRDLGFHAMGNILKREPEIYELPIEPGAVMILGSDGLLDPSHDSTAILNQAKRIAQLVLDGAEATDLINDALSRITGDNVTAIVYRR
jgi:serine/threonine protein phosphatase PrpC